MLRLSLPEDEYRKLESKYPEIHGELDAIQWLCIGHSLELSLHWG